MTIDEFAHLHTLPAGADWRFVEGIGIVVCAPNIEPYIVHTDGSIEVVKIPRTAHVE